VNGLVPLAALLNTHAEKLDSHEIEQLERAWPEARRTRFLDSADPAYGPDASLVDAWFHLNVAEVEPQESLDILVRYVGPIIQRLQKKSESKQLT
jgi:hypothetical protein